MKRFVCFAFASFFCRLLLPRRRTTNLYEKRETNYTDYETWVHASGEKTFKRMTGQATLKLKGDVARPCQYKSLQVQVVALRFLIAGPGVWLCLRSGLPSSKALLQNKAVIETIPSRPPFPKILMSIIRGRWEVEKQSIGWKVLRMCINLLMPNAEPEGQCVVIMFTVCSFRYLVAVVVGDT